VSSPFQVKYNEKAILERRIYLFHVIKKTVQPVVHFYSDKVYFSQLYRLAAPITLQNLLTASLGMVGNVMVGQLGDTAMAASSLAGQIFFLLILILFGIGSGSAMFTAQLWGKKDIVSLRKVQGLCLALGLAVAFIFFLLSEFFSRDLIGFFSTDPQVILLGGDFLKLYAWAFLFFSVTSGFAAILRSIGEVKIPLVITVAALAFNIILNYGLIFGNLGLPKMGLQGAALSAVIARALECIALVVTVYWIKSPIAASLGELTRFDLNFIGQVFKPVLPVILNELLWSTAITMYNFVYARIGTPSMAAMNIVATVDNLALVPFMGLSGAVAIMAGNKIGAGEYDDAYHYVGRTLGLTAFIALLVGLIVLAIKTPVIGLYKITPDVVVYANNGLIILGAWLIVRSQNMILIVGALRSGGDTRYSLFLDGLIIWFLGVPMALLGGFILRLPVYWVYLMVMSEELTKCILGLRRFFSHKWIHDLTQIKSSTSAAGKT
jgi:putative MATE family efflux protein